MSLRVLYLLVCLASVMTIAYGINPWPRKVPTIEEQCRAAGHKGACSDLNYDAHGLRCWDIICKRKTPTRNGHKTISIGPSVDGVRCAFAKLCVGGQCVDPGLRRQPIPVGLDPQWRCAEDHRRN